MYITKANELRVLDNKCSEILKKLDHVIQKNRHKVDTGQLNYIADTFWDKHWEIEKIDHKYIHTLKKKQHKSVFETAMCDYIKGNNEKIGILLKNTIPSLFGKIKYGLNIKDEEDVYDGVQLAVMVFLQKVKTGMFRARDIDDEISGFLYTVAKIKVVAILREKKQSLVGINSNGEEFDRSDVFMKTEKAY